MITPGCTNPQLGKIIALYETGKLSPEEEIEFEAHLLECDYCFREISGMATVMRALREVVKREKRDRQTVEEESKKATILMFPVQRETESITAEKALALAAKGKETISPFTLLGEFYSKDQTVFMRVLRNETTSEVMCFLLSEDSRKSQNVMIEIEGLKKKYLSNDQCIVSLGKDPDIDFSKAQISIHTPVALFQLSLHEGFFEKEIMETKIPLESEEHDRIILSIDEEKIGRN
jgi:hypothetical protein